MSELKAGRELDALVAEKVMGLVPCDAWLYANLGSAGGAVSMNHGCEHAAGRCYPRRTSLPFGGPPKLSTDIAAAWEVVERMRGDGFAFEVSSVWHGEGTYASFARWERIVGEGPYYADVEPDGQSRAPTAPLAICLAALAACQSRAEP